MNTRSINKRTVILFLALAIIAASGIAFAAKRTPHRNTQMTLPLALPQVKTDKIMPPDPDDWCKKVKLSKLDYEIEKAEEYFASGFGGSLIRWNYLRLALEHTGVTWNGAEDEEWLKFVKGMYKGCER